MRRVLHILLALFMTAFSAASAMHDVFHHGTHDHAADEQYLDQAHTETHTQCQFCAKGPTVATDGYITADFCIITEETFAAVHASSVLSAPSLFLQPLRGPPLA